MIHPSNAPKAPDGAGAFHQPLAPHFIHHMANYNKVILMGNLTADPDVRTTPKGTQVTELRLAINRFVSGDNNGDRREETTFVDVTCWGRTAEIAAQYLTKGRPVFLEGRLQYDTWDDKATGQKRSKLRVVAENLQLMGSPRDGGGNSAPQQQRNYGNQNGGYNRQQNNNYDQQSSGYSQPRQNNPAPPAEEFDDDIPF